MRLITYMSTAHKLLDKGQLKSLLDKSRKANGVNDITGMLLYKAGTFIQAIEGPDAAVTQLYQNIKKDPLHHGIFTLINESVTERLFPQWEMGYRELSSTDISEGFRDFFQEHELLEEYLNAPSDAKQLLAVFASTR